MTATDPSSLKALFEVAGIPMPAKMTPWEEYVLEHAARFRMQRGSYRNNERAEADTFGDAVSYAKRNKGARPWMIYAITADGRDAHIVNV